MPCRPRLEPSGTGAQTVRVLLIRHHMSRPVTTVGKDQTVGEVYQLFRRKHIRRAPVVHDGTLVGMVTEADLLHALPFADRLTRSLAAGDESRPVERVMARSVARLGPNDHLHDAARLMLERKIGGVPVVEGRSLVGMITESDIFRALVREFTRPDTQRLTIQAAAVDQATDPVRVCVSLDLRLVGMTGGSLLGGAAMTTLLLGPGDLDPLVGRLGEGGWVVLERWP